MTKILYIGTTEIRMNVSDYEILFIQYIFCYTILFPASLCQYKEVKEFAMSEGVISV